MKLDLPGLFTPLYLKLSHDMPWPEEEKVFYLLTGDGCFLCRNHAFFRSSVPAPRLPVELAPHAPHVKLSYPKLPQRDFERIAGFFDVIGRRHGAEAAVLLAWNTETQTVETLVPPQISIVGSSWNAEPYPIELHYQVPKLPAHLLTIGDIHSHVDGAAYASHTDRHDETHRPGLHIVVGRIRDEPPQFHIEAVVDGARFEVDSVFSVVQGYKRRRAHEVPQSWIDRVTVMTWSEYYNQHGAVRDRACFASDDGDAERRRLDSWLRERNPGNPGSAGNGSTP